MTDSARIYGGSLYDLAKEEGVTSEMLDQMEEIRALFREYPDYPRLLSEPSIPLADRQKLMTEAFGEEAEHYLINFLKLLCERGGIGIFADCCKEFRRRYDADNDIARAEVVSAVPLNEAQIAALKEKLQKQCGKKLHIRVSVDPSVMGGILVDLDGKRMDGTVQGRLAGISKLFEEAAM